MKKKNWLEVVLSLSKEYRTHIFFSIVFGIISVAGDMLPYFAVSNIIILFFEEVQTTEKILYWSGIALLGYFIKILFYIFSTLLSHYAAFSVLENMRLKIAGKLMRAPLGTVLNKTVGKIKNIMVDEVEKIETPLAHMIPEFTSNLLIPLVIVIYIAYLDWRMAIGSLISIPLSMLAYAGMFKNYKKNYDAYMEASNHMNSTIIEYVEGIEVIKAFNQSSDSYEKYSHAVTSFRDYTLKWFRGTWKYTASGAAILPSTLIGSLPMGMYLYVQGEITASIFVTCLILSLGIVPPLLSLAGVVNKVQVIGYAVEETNKFMETEELSSVTENVNLKDYNIEFKNVGFSYDEDKEDNILKDISISIPQGEFTALVGSSGSGKSTMARLVARFWDTKKGEITIGGVEIKDIPLTQLMDTVSFVTQDNFLFNCSILENIRLGNPKATDEEVIKAAESACCDDFIAKLPDKYNTRAGDAGGRLSGGEKQRIAIARAILKDAPIVLLGEATAFTDPENEDKLQKSVATLTKGKTLLVIAHRLSTIKNADKIAVLQDGKIVAMGKQKELLESCPLYKDMWKAHLGSKAWIAGKREEKIC